MSSPWVMDSARGTVHIHRRFEGEGSRTWCGVILHPVYAADFIKAPKQHQQQCIPCQDAEFKEGDK